MHVGIIAVPEDILPLNFWGNKQIQSVMVHTPEQAALLDAVVLAGSDSLALQEYLVKNNLLEVIRTKVKQGTPIWGISAGLYLMAKTKLDSSFSSLDVMDVVAGKAQSPDCYTVPLYIQAFGFEPVVATFREPVYIAQVEPHVGIMAYYQGKVIMARQGNMLVSAFFTQEGEFRAADYFLQMVEDNFE